MFFFLVRRGLIWLTSFFADKHRETSHGVTCFCCLQVYLLSFAKEDALTQWMRKLNTAMIIGEAT